MAKSKKCQLAQVSVSNGDDSDHGSTDHDKQSEREICTISISVGKGGWWRQPREEYVADIFSTNSMTRKQGGKYYPFIIILFLHYWLDQPLQGIDTARPGVAIGDESNFDHVQSPYLCTENEHSQTHKNEGYSSYSEYSNNNCKSSYCNGSESSNGQLSNLESCHIGNSPSTMEGFGNESLPQVKWQL